MKATLRIARPVSQLEERAAQYRAGLGLDEVGRFAGHDGFDGIMLAASGERWHLEFTYCHHHSVLPAPTAEDLLVFYLPDAAHWQATCHRMLAAGFLEVEAFNPYWSQKGRTFVDPDGYRVVLQQAAWDEKD